MIRLSRNLIGRSSMLISRCEFSASSQTIATQDITSSSESIINNSFQNIPEIKDELHASKLRQVLNMPVEASTGINDTSPSEHQKFLELFRLHNSSLDVSGGHMIKARVLNVDKKRILLDTGIKIAKIGISDITPECILEKSTRDSTPRESPTEVRPGDVLQVYLEHFESPEGDMLVSGQQAAVRRRVRAVWKELQNRLKDGRPVKGRILNAVSGGFSVGVAGLVCFLPVRSTARSTAQRIGELQDFKVVQMNPARNNVVLVDCKMQDGLEKIFARHGGSGGKYGGGGGGQRRGGGGGEDGKRWRQQQQQGQGQQQSGNQPRRREMVMDAAAEISQELEKQATTVHTVHSSNASDNTTSTATSSS